MVLPCKRLSFSILGGSGYTRSNVSSVFFLQNNENILPFIANVKPGNDEYAIYCKPIMVERLVGVIIFILVITLIGTNNPTAILHIPIKEPSPV